MRPLQQSKKDLFEKKNVDCYIFNTGHFGEKKVTPAITLGSLESIVESKAKFTDMGVSGMQYLPVDGFNPDFTDASYKKQFVARLKDRIGFLENKMTARGGYDKLPQECVDSMKAVAADAEKL